MMTPSVRKSWKSAIKNKEFQKDALSADGDKFPSMAKRLIMDEIEKIIWATIYYGWLIGKYGDDWEIERKKFL